MMHLTAHCWVTLPLRGAMSAGSEAGSVAVSAAPHRSAAPPAPSAAPPLAAARRRGCAAAARLASLAGWRPPPLRPTGRRPSLARPPPGSARARPSRCSTARGRRRACLRRARRRRCRPGPRVGAPHGRVTEGSGGGLGAGPPADSPRGCSSRPAAPPQALRGRRSRAGGRPWERKGVGGPFLLSPGRRNPGRRKCTGRCV